MGEAKLYKLRNYNNNSAGTIESMLHDLNSKLSGLDDFKNDIDIYDDFSKIQKTDIPENEDYKSITQQNKYISSYNNNDNKGYEKNNNNSALTWNEALLDYTTSEISDPNYASNFYKHEDNFYHNENSFYNDINFNYTKESELLQSFIKNDKNEDIKNCLDDIDKEFEELEKMMQEAGIEN